MVVSPAVSNDASRAQNVLVERRARAGFEVAGCRMVFNMVLPRGAIGPSPTMHVPTKRRRVAGGFHQFSDFSWVAEWVVFHGITDVVSVRKNRVQSLALRPVFETELSPAKDPILKTVSLPATFDEFYSLHRDGVAKALAFTVGSASLAEEATDEAMARAYQKWSEVGAYDNPSGWVYRTGLNWARSWRRSAFRRQRREVHVATDLQTTAPAASGESSDLFRALDALSHEHRSVVVLRHYCDWSVSATAEALDISEGTVKSRNARALEQLRRVMQGRDG